DARLGGDDALLGAHLGTWARGSLVDGHGTHPWSAAAMDGSRLRTFSGTGLRTTRSTRRLASNGSIPPVSVRGRASPKPVELIRPGGIPPASTRRRSTLVARSADSSQLLS